MRALQAISFAKEILKKITENPHLEAELLISKACECSKEEVYAKNPEVPEKKLMEFLSLRKNHYPLQYILGEVEFFSRKFKIREGVFIPRPETEVLVEKAIEIFNEGDRILEIGVGSGVISITLALERPDLIIFADDINPLAVYLARENSERMGAKVKFVVGDCTKPFREKFQGIISNPPYIAPGEPISPELKYEPKEAYLAPPDGFSFIERLVKEARKLLDPGGRILLEISPFISEKIRKTFGATVFKDLSGRDRVSLIMF